MEDLTQGIECFPIYGPQHANHFQYVKTNVPGPECTLELFLEEFEGCSCDKVCSSDFCPCLRIFGPAYNNGLLMEKTFSSGQPTRSIIECGKNCKCDTSICSLRLVQKGIQSKVRVITTVEKGYGLMAEEEIPRSAFVCEYAGEIVSENEAKKRLKMCEELGKMNYLIAVKEYGVLSQSQTYVDPRIIGNIGRFINHSCDPNLIMIPVRVNHSVPRLALFAKRKIFSGEELTFDYSGCTCLDDVMPEKSTDEKRVASLCSEIAVQTNLSSQDLQQNLGSNGKERSLLTLSNVSPKKEENAEPFHSVNKRKINADLTIKPSQNTSRSVKTSKLKESSETEHSDQANVIQYNSDDKTLLPSHSREKTNETNSDDISVDTSKDNLSIPRSKIPRRMCFCQSTNCKGFLPYDSQLFFHA